MSGGRSRRMPTPRRHAAASLSALAGLCALLGGPAAAGSAVADAVPAMPQADHCVKPAIPDRAYRRQLGEYRSPDVPLTRADGVRTTSGEALDSPGPVMLNFIFTSCSSICPILSATFSQVGALLKDEAPQLRFVSISIDPEQDTPAVLQRYAQRYGADGRWQFLTGSRDDIIALQRAFDALRGNKTGHRPLTFLRRDPAGPWLRIEGFPKAEELAREYRALATGPQSVPEAALHSGL